MARRKYKKRERIIILGNAKKPRVKPTARRFRSILERKAAVVAVDLEERLDLARIKADLVIVFGGDGAPGRAPLVPRREAAGDPVEVARGHAVRREPWGPV